MRKPFFKKYLSYFNEFLLEKSESEHNPELYVFLTKGRFQLCTDTAIYSYDDKYDNFRSAFDKIKIKERKVESVLLLGLGLASIPYMLEKIYKQDYQYTAVEIDKEICRLASKYVLSELESNVQIYPVDALEFVEWNEQKFDLIAMDIFQSAIIPEEFESVDFIQSLSSRINENGIIMYNRLSDNKTMATKNEEFYKKWLSFHPNGTYIQTRNNRVYINDENLIDI